MWRAARAGIMGAAVAAGGGGAFPVWETADDTAAQSSLAAGAHTHPYPANAAVGDIIVFWYSSTSSNELSGVTGFTSAGGWTQNFQRTRIYWRRYDGTEGATFPFTTSATAYTAVRAIRISGAIATGTPIESSSGTTSGASANPDAPSFSPSWGSAKTLWFAVASIDGGVTVNAYSSGYVNGIANGTTEILALCSRQLETATEDPSAWTLSAARAWVAQTVAIRPAA